MSGQYTLCVAEIKTLIITVHAMRGRDKEFNITTVTPRRIYAIKCLLIHGYDYCNVVNCVLLFSLDLRPSLASLT